MLAKFWKNNPKLIGAGAYYLFKVLGSTLRVKVKTHPAIDPNKAYLFAFWHGKQILPSIIAKNYHFTKRCAMVSPSRDGSLLAVYLVKAGFEIIRGSSRDNGASALIKMNKKLKQNASIGFAIDGPTGPLYSVKPGIIYLAKKTGLEIIPLGSGFNKAWTFKKAWDKFQLPKPFSRAGMVFGEPFSVAPNMSIEEASATLRDRLHIAESDAINLTAL